MFCRGQALRLFRDFSDLPHKAAIRRRNWGFAGGRFFRDSAGCFCFCPSCFHERRGAEKALGYAVMSKITKSSAAEYFAKNLQQVGFSSPTKAVLTTLKEAVDNSLDACEEAGILPEIHVKINREGKGSTRNADLIYLMIQDNGPGLEEKNIAKVFGEYLASSKFGQGRCSRGQQGIGISAATTWAQLTNARGVRAISKTKQMPKALSALVGMDIKNNKGVLKDKKSVFFDNPHGLKVEFFIDGRVQLNGEGGLITYLEGTALVNPHLELKYQLLDKPPREIKRVSDRAPVIPPAVLPHPHTMKLGEFLQHIGFYGRMALKKFLKTGFSRITDRSIKEMKQKGLGAGLLEKPLTSIKEQEYKKIFSILHETPLPNPSTKSVLVVGEDGLQKALIAWGMWIFQRDHQKAQNLRLQACCGGGGHSPPEKSGKKR